MNSPVVQLGLESFAGQAPLFPLPATVLFPQQSLPLHVFEPRYRQMAADVLQGNRLMAVGLLQDGWEPDYAGRPPIHEMVCLGRVIKEQRLPDGRFNLIVRGLARAAIVREVPGDTPYRVAQLELYRDLYPSDSTLDRETRRRELVVAFHRLFPQSRVAPLFDELLRTDLPLGALCDMMSVIMRIPPASKQVHLEEVDVDERSRALLTDLRRECAAAGWTAEQSARFSSLSLN